MSFVIAGDIESNGYEGHSRCLRVVLYRVVLSFWRDFRSECGKIGKYAPLILISEIKHYAELCRPKLIASFLYLVLEMLMELE